MANRGLFLALAAAMAQVACDQDQQIPRAEFRRPAGMAYAERPVALTCPVGPIVDRATFEGLGEDERALLSSLQAVTTESFEAVLSGSRQATLFVADSEAEGVRVQQYLQVVSVVSETGTAAEQLAANERNIVPGPVVFFDLVLSARGFPTEVALSKDRMVLQTSCTYPNEYSGQITKTSTDGTQMPVDVSVDLDPGGPEAFTVAFSRTAARAARGFVLALEGGPSGDSSAISIIDTRPRPFQSRADDFRGFGIDEIDLGASRHTAGPWTTTDLEVIAYVGEGACSEPVVVEDPIAATPCDDAGVDIIALVQDPIADRYGRLVFISVSRAGAPPAFVPVRLPEPAHPGTMVVLEDRVLVSNAEGPEIFEVPYTVTGTVVAPGPVRAIDVGGPTRHLIDGGPVGLFAVRLDLPRLVYLERDEAGEVVRSDLRLASPLAYEADPGNPQRRGQIDVRDSPLLAAGLGEVEQLEQTFAAEGVLAAVNEEDFFGAPRAPVVLLAHADATINFVVGSPPRLATLRGDRIAQFRRLETEQGDPPIRVVGCEEQLVNDAPDPDGPIPACFPIAAEPLQCDGDEDMDGEPDVVLRSTASSATYRVTYRGAVLTAEEGAIGGVDTSTIIRVSGVDTTRAPIRFGDSVLLQADVSACVEGQPAVVRNGVVVGFTDTTVDVRADSFGLPPSCANQVQWFEVYPSGDEVVYATYDGARLDEVLQRVPVTLGAGVDQDDGFRVTFDGFSLAGDPLDLILTVEGSASVPVATSTSANVPEGSLDEGRICGTAGDCPSNFNCEPDIGADENPRTCFGRCRADLDDCLEVDCVDRRIARRGVQLDVAGTPLASIALIGQLSGQFAATRLALPEDVVFSPMRGSWLISVPGSRAVAEVTPREGQIGVATIR